MWSCGKVFGGLRKERGWVKKIIFRGGVECCGCKVFFVLRFLYGRKVFFLVGGFILR